MSVYLLIGDVELRTEPEGFDDQIFPARTETGDFYTGILVCTGSVSYRAAPAVQWQTRDWEVHPFLRMSHPTKVVGYVVQMDGPPGRTDGLTSRFTADLAITTVLDEDREWKPVPPPLVAT